MGVLGSSLLLTVIPLDFVPVGLYLSCIKGYSFSFSINLVCPLIYGDSTVVRTWITLLSEPHKLAAFLISSALQQEIEKSFLLSPTHRQAVLKSKALTL